MSGKSPHPDPPPQERERESSGTNRGAIVAAARAWIGTPYQHQASLIHVGCDCLGLVRGVRREVNGPEPEEAPPYTPD